MKKIIMSALALTMGMTLAGCGSSSTSSTSGKKTVTINVATSPDYAPYESLNKKNEVVGFDADMVKLFPKYLNTSTTTYKFKWNQMSFDNIVSQILLSLIRILTSRQSRT